MLLSKDFTKLVILATLAAWPLAYFAMDRWLQDFAYRISINSQYDTFVWSAVLAFAIAVLTVIYQAVKVAISNPVKALRYE